MKVFTQFFSLDFMSRTFVALDQIFDLRNVWNVFERVRICVLIGFDGVGTYVRILVNIAVKILVILTQKTQAKSNSTRSVLISSH